MHTKAKETIMQKNVPMEIPVHRGTIYKSPEERQREDYRWKEIASLFLLYGDSIEGLEIPLFGEGSGADNALDSVDRVNRDAKRIAEHLHIEYREAVDFITRISMAKSLQRSFAKHKSSRIGAPRFK